MPFLPPGGLPHPGIEPVSPSLARESLAPPGKAVCVYICIHSPVKRNKSEFESGEVDEPRACYTVK